MTVSTALLLALAALQPPPLADIVVTGKVEEARAAIAQGAAVDDGDADGVTALMRAASAGRADMVRLLLAHKANALATTRGGADALMMAALGGYHDAVGPLLAAKAQPNAKDNQGRTALMAAASSGDLATVEALLAGGADPKAEDGGGATAITYASAEGFAAAVEAMQKRGARPRDRDLMLAAARCHTAIVRSFLAGGVDPKIASAGTTPLIAAAGGNCAETVDLLIGAGADLNATNGDGWTPLIKAAAAGHTEVVRVLLAKGADMNVSDSLGRTAWMYASMSRREEIAELFRRARAAAHPPAALVVSSPALKHGETMSREFTADGHNVSPPLAWSAVPERTQSIAVICEDPDAGNPPPFVHWVIYNIPAAAGGLPENVPFTPGAPMPASIAGAVQGMSGFRRAIYRGPAPPPGKPHHYHFKVYALDVDELPAGLNRAELLEAMKDHIVGHGELVAIYERKP